MNLGMSECHIPFSGHCHLQLLPSFNNNCVRSISLILFEIEISGWWSVLYHLRVTVTLTFDLVYSKIMSKAYLSYYKSWNPKFGVWMQLWMAECHILFSGHYDLDL